MMGRIFQIVFVLLAACVFVSAQSARIPKWILEEKFVRACDEANIEVVRRLLKLGISPDTRDRFGQPALHRVLRPGVTKRSSDIDPTVDLLLDSGAKINATNDFGSNILFFTTRPVPGIDDRRFETLVRRGAEATLKDRFGQGYQAAWENYDERTMPRHDHVWRLVIEGGIRFRELFADVKPYRNSATFAMAVAYYGEAYQFSTKPDFPDEFDSNGENYLFYMASRTRFHSFELLGIDRQLVDKVSSSGETALIRAARFDNDHLVSKLLGAGAKTDIRDKAGLNALDYSVEYDQFLTTLALLSRSDPNDAASGKLPIFRAIENGNMNAVAAFVHAKLALPKLLAEPRTDPLEKEADLKLAQAFRRIDLEKRDAKGQTPLIAAVQSGNIQIVEALLKASVNRDLRDRAGGTALEIAKAKGNVEIVRLLSAK